MTKKGRWASLTPQQKAWLALHGGCLDHGKRAQQDCDECERVAVEYISGRRVPNRPNPGGEAGMVRALCELDEQDLARACEALLCKHLGIGIEVRTDPSEEDAT